MNNIDCARRKILTVISGSKIPEDLRHAENTLEWVLRLKPEADEALQLAALAHDIERANEVTKVKRADFENYDAFKAAHAKHSTKILRQILQECQVDNSIVEEACRLVLYHEIGGDPGSDLLKDADSISFFDVNLPFYYQRESREETLHRCIWGYRRLSAKGKDIVQHFYYDDENLTTLLKQAIKLAEKDQD